LSTIQEILRGVNRETLDAVVQEWMIQLQKCIDGNGQYIESCLNWNVQFLFLNGISCDARFQGNTLDFIEALRLEADTKTYWTTNAII
jgi:hypothetical protein